MTGPSLSLTCLVLTPVLFAGCLTVEKSYPQKRYYVLVAPRPGPPSDVTINGVLRVRSFQTSPSYGGSEFVYRTRDVAFESDFYNEFFRPPSRLLTEEARRWFRASGLFRAVVDSSSAIESTHTLEGAVTAIYGDYTVAGSPAAALELQFFLLKNDGTRVDIAFQKTYSRTARMGDDSPAALVRGWNEALVDILAALEADLRGAGLE